MIARRNLLAIPVGLAVPPIADARAVPPHGTFIGLWYKNGPMGFVKPWQAAAWYHGECGICPYYTSGNTAEEALARMRAGFERNALCYGSSVPPQWKS
jgi:hypothetical protein